MMNFRLIESGHRKQRNPREAVFSLAVHSVLIAAFVYATAQQSEVILPSSGTIQRVTFAVQRAPKAAPAPAAPKQQPAPRPKPAASTTPAPPITEASAAPPSTDLTAATGTGVAGGERDAYYDYEVGSIASMIGGIRPRYPESLRLSNVEGRVEVEFVVDERGRVDMRTVKVVESTHALFTSAVRNALNGMRFNPAKVNGVAVRQYVRLPVVFQLDR